MLVFCYLCALDAKLVAKVRIHLGLLLLFAGQVLNKVGIFLGKLFNGRFLSGVLLFS